jgi:hypothetical protein
MKAEQIREIMSNESNKTYGGWKAVPAERRLHSRPDIHIFLMLHEKFPEASQEIDMVSCATHDEIFLEVSPESENSLTEQDVRDLSNAGLRYDRSTDSFAMFA